VCAAVCAGPALAAGPVDVEVGALYWAHDLELEMVETVEYSADAPALFGEVWINKLGFTADWYQSDVDEPDVGDAEVDYKSLDARWKLLEVPGGNFLAVGAGMQQIDLSGDGESFDSTGFRIVADAKLGLGRIVYAFGEAAIWTGLDDFEGEGVLLEDPSGHEIEVGISIKPAPFFNIKAGYRTSTLDYDADGMGAEWAADGFFAGLSINL
jgi:hypothetical protein